jgi:hypothetical protein
MYRTNHETNELRAHNQACRERAARDARVIAERARDSASRLAAATKAVRK